MAESPVNLECVVRDVIEYPSHDMFVAEIVCVHGDKTLFDETGRFCLDEAGLIAYSHGEYFGLKHRPLGRFGYSVMKSKTRRRIRRNRELHENADSSRTGRIRISAGSQPQREPELTASGCRESRQNETESA